jgi:hypothetical protein
MLACCPVEQASNPVVLASGLVMFGPLAQSCWAIEASSPVVADSRQVVSALSKVGWALAKSHVSLWPSPESFRPSFVLATCPVEQASKLVMWTFGPVSCGPPAQ